MPPLLLRLHDELINVVHHILQVVEHGCDLIHPDSDGFSGLSTVLAVIDRGSH